MCFLRRNMPEKGIEKPKKLCYDTKMERPNGRKGGFAPCRRKKSPISSWCSSLRCSPPAAGAPAALGTEYHIQKLNDNALTEPEQGLTCTITIRCDTVLQSLDSLREEKLPYVPRDGVMLPETTVSFAEGETAFGVLQRVCAAAELQLEYSWTPLYDSYYIEGIGHLYEFDAGPESGWMYKVNGSFPNYGCSSYVLTGGEEIVWCYTCAGLGDDVGAAGMVK